ncbi:YolD-like family protein [Mangrovibacillus cuniculi]|uniref:YolD-like family protein n=1 Tax=Mangrovibacillus cuniculi TaxID=2593652 RepID=A0A7S8HFC8_9BACI|nr:YolD-like family protein [Mangrovibacillus cuniculi]QPC46774.1 YolD-like family protein [Mangrovibacillus cuniculi]
MIRDRGRIKWTSMMLPEHVKILREQQMRQNEQKQPELDMHMWEELNERLQEALDGQQLVTLTYFEGGYFQEVIGVVRKVDMLQRVLMLEGKTETRKVSMEKVTNLELVDK